MFISMSTMWRRKLQVVADTWCSYIAWLRTESSYKFTKSGTGPGPIDRHVLLLASSFPPRTDGGVYRPTALVKYGVKLGWKFSVVTLPAPSSSTEAGRELLSEVPSEVRVERLSSPLPEPSHKLFPRISGGLSTALAMVALVRARFVSNPPAVVMATGPFFSTFVAALFITRQFGAKLVLDYRDEWTECPFEFVNLGNVDRWWEKRCLTQADAVVFVTDTLHEHHKQVFAELRDKQTLVIRNGWDMSRQAGDPAMSTAVYPNSNLRHISFVGTLGNFNMPDSFLRCIEKVLDAEPALADSLRLRFVGRKSPAAEQSLAAFRYPHLLECAEHLPKRKADEMMRESSVLLLLNPPALAGCLSGKLYEYVASGRPILVYGCGGESAGIVEDLNSGAVVPSDDDVAMQKALRHFDQWHPQQDHEARRDQWLLAHSRSAMAKRMCDLFESLVYRRTASSPIRRTGLK